MAATNVWRLMQAYRGWKAANSPPAKPKPPTEAQFEAFMLKETERELGSG